MANDESTARPPPVESWARIEAWLQKRAKRIFKVLGPPADDAALDRAQAALGVVLPDGVRQSYKVHDGAEESDLFPSSEPEGMAYSLMSLNEVVEHAALGVQRDGWPAGLVPIATNGGGDYQCVDLAPGPDRGRVVEVDHETGRTATVAPSWAARLADLADGLEVKRYRYDADDGIVHPKPPDPTRGLREARRLLAEEPTRPAHPHVPRPLGPEYADVLAALDAAGRPLAPAPLLRVQALCAFLGVGDGDAVRFFEYFSAPAPVDYNGLRFHPIPDVVELNVPHWLPDGKPFPLVIATTLTGGGRVCFDIVRNQFDPPLVLYPSDFDPKGKRKPQLVKAGTVVAHHLLDFMRKLTRNELRL